METSQRSAGRRGGLKTFLGTLKQSRSFITLSEKQNKTVFVTPNQLLTLPPTITQRNVKLSDLITS